MRISVPIAKLGLVPSGDLYEGQFLVYFVVRDASGNQSDLSIQRQEVKIPTKDLDVAQRKDFYYDATLLVVPGGQKLAVGVRDSRLQPDLVPAEAGLRLGATRRAQAGGGPRETRHP